MQSPSNCSGAWAENDIHKILKSIRGILSIVRRIIGYTGFHTKGEKNTAKAPSIKVCEIETLKAEAHTT